MRPESVKVYPITENKPFRDLLVLDCSRAWFLELPSTEKNLDNYTVCVSGYNKDFKSLFGVETHKELADAFLKEYHRGNAMDTFLERIRGKKEFKVNDFRLDSSSTKLDRFIYQCAQKRYNVPLEYFMYWYRGVSKHLLAANLPEDNVIALLKKRPLQLGFFYAHGGWGHTPETLSKRLLEKPFAPQVYDEYAKPIVRVTRKMIAAFRKELEQEYRKKLGSDTRPLVEEFIQYRSYGVSDDYIADCLRSRQSAADVVYWETY